MGRVTHEHESVSQSVGQPSYCEESNLSPGDPHIILYGETPDGKLTCAIWTMQDGKWVKTHFGVGGRLQPVN
ncbi:MAG: hypothetical protein Q7S28_00115 [bacterium]|nr:hypothetical protein [bacterium]